MTADALLKAAFSTFRVSVFYMSILAKTPPSIKSSSFLLPLLIDKSRIFVISASISLVYSLTS